MNCIIIEDDPLSMRVVEEFVKRTDFLDLKHEFNDAVEAINTLNVGEEDIDLIFLILFYYLYLYLVLCLVEAVFFVGRF